VAFYAMMSLVDRTCSVVGVLVLRSLAALGGDDVCPYRRRGRAEQSGEFEGIASSCAAHRIYHVPGPDDSGH
jgi:hypothetical protein